MTWRRILAIMAIFATVALVVSGVAHFARWAVSPQDDSQMNFWSIREWWESVGGLHTFVLSVCLTVTATLFGLRGAKQTNAYLEDTRDTIRELKEATSWLVSYTQNAIRDFPACKLRAEAMLATVSDDLDSEVRIAVFWPMFGADSGPQFQRTGIPAFGTNEDSPFYRALFERINHNFTTELLFLEYEAADSDQSELAKFIDALASYRNALSGKPPNFSLRAATALKKAATLEITERLIPLARARSKVRLMVIEDLPVLLFIVDHGASSPSPMKEALLFIGNCTMIESDLAVGGFHTLDPEMVDVLEGLFVSLSGKARKLRPTAVAKP